MGLINLFRQKQPAENLPTAADYVEWLLQYMLRTSCTELTINTNSPVLPGSSASDKTNPPPCIPDAQMVINRLKILSGINPVFKDPNGSKGSFERPRKHYILNITTQFKDKVNSSECHISIKVRCMTEQ